MLHKEGSNATQANGSSLGVPTSESRYDYIIVGGGTSGLVVANRLSEDPTLMIAVIEAGDSVFNDPNVINTTTFGMALGTSVDWQYPSEPQRYTLNRTFTYNAGKALGGTSAINGMTYMRPQDVQIDSWEQLGNTGWNWSSLWPYFKKSEKFQIPTAEQELKGARYDYNNHGFDGAVTVGWSSTLMGGDTHKILNATWQTAGIPYERDINGGKLRGFSVWPFTLNNSGGGEGIRQDAARAYYYPVAGRSNLHVYLNTTASRLVWADREANKGDLLSASGVEMYSATWEIRNLQANREVILSAGSLRSPLLLEHSGVGNPVVLKRHSIPIRIALPSVGENLQDQPNSVMSFSFALNTTGYPPYVTVLSAKDLFAAEISGIEAHLRSSIPEYAAEVARSAANATSPETIQKLFEIQANLIFQKDTPIAEILHAPVAGALQIVVPFWNLLPFARGSVHIQSSNASAPPAINPNFFQFPFDAAVQTAIGRAIRRAFATPPLSNYISRELSPNTTIVPVNASDEAWGHWLRSTYGPNYHPVGTAAMMSRELGGVVDPEMRVYGTRNVRVVDASVLPFQVCGHLTSTLYAIAERASDLIRRYQCSDGGPGTA